MNSKIQNPEILIVNDELLQKKLKDECLLKAYKIIKKGIRQRSSLSYIYFSYT